MWPRTEKSLKPSTKRNFLSFQIDFLRHFCHNNRKLIYCIKCKLHFTFFFWFVTSFDCFCYLSISTAVFVLHEPGDVKVWMTVWRPRQCWCSCVRSAERCEGHTETACAYALPKGGGPKPSAQPSRYGNREITVDIKLVRQSYLHPASIIYQEASTPTPSSEEEVH